MSAMTFQEMTPVSFLERAARVFAQRPAVVDGDLRYSYGEFWQRAQRLAGMLAEHGVQPATGWRSCARTPTCYSRRTTGYRSRVPCWWR